MSKRLLILFFFAAAVLFTGCGTTPPDALSSVRERGVLRDRAAQFAPFAALTGYEAAVGETARLTAERRELDPQEAEELNRRLAALIARLPERPEVTVEYFVPDDRKAGVRM